MTNTLRALAALCLVSLGLIASGCGASSGSGASDPASVIPDSSFLYAEATIDPSGAQEDAMRSILGDLPGTGAPQDRLEDLIRDAIKKDKTTKVDWDEDIKPWLGDKVAGFVAGSGASLTSGNVPAAVVVSTTDGDKARDALEKNKDASAAHKRYRDVEYIVESEDGSLSAEGVVDGYLVGGTDAGMKAVIDASKDGRTLDKADKFKQAIKDVPDERVGFAYADLGGLIQLASQASGNQFPAGALFGRLLAGKPLVIAARAENQALIFEGRSPSTVKSGSGAATLMQDLPQSSWAAVALPDLGSTIRSFYTGFAGAFGGSEALGKQVRDATGLDIEQDVLSWIGDVGLFVDGDSKETLGGGLLVMSKNPAASKQALTKIAAAITRADQTTRVAAAHVPGAFGYELRSPDVPRSIFMLQRDDRVAFTYGDSEAKDALSGGGLAGSSDFKRAAGGLGDGYSPLVYVSVPPILRVADAFGATSDQDYVKAKPYLTILDYLIAGTTGNGNDGRFRIGFKPHE
jgi:hypothetical protein